MSQTLRNVCFRHEKSQTLRNFYSAEKYLRGCLDPKKKSADISTKKNHGESTYQEITEERPYQKKYMKTYPPKNP